MRVLVTGAGGQLGRALARALDGHEALLLPRAALDVTDPVAVEGVIRSAEPEAIVHTASWTDVDGCEMDPERARLCNVLGTQHVVESAGRAHVTVISTDYVFDGAAGRAYTERDEPSPVQVYGRTKRDAEEIALSSGARVAVVRTAWLYGAGGKNFVAAILRALRSGPVEVVMDQVGSPTSCDDLARAITHVVQRQPLGVFHAVNEGAVSRWELARSAARAAGFEESLVRPVTTASAPPRPARRPPYAPLEPRAWLDEGFPALAPWDDALRRALPGILAAS